MRHPLPATLLVLALAAPASAGNVVTPPLGPPPGGSARCDVYNAGTQERTVGIAIFDARNLLVATSTNPVRIGPGEIGSAFNPAAFAVGPTRCEVGGGFAGARLAPLRGSSRGLLTTLCGLDQSGKCVVAVSVP